MNIENAETAGVLARAIKVRLEKIAQIDAAIESEWVVSQFTVVAPDGQDAGLLLDRLDVATSAAALGFAKQIYQAQLDDLNAKLAAI